MFFSRRKLLGVFPFIAVAPPAVARAPASPEDGPRTVLGHHLHDDVSVSLLEDYARSLALEDERARWEAQMRFHETQITREWGGTMAHKLGYAQKRFVEAHERGGASLPDEHYERSLRTSMRHWRPSR